MFAQVPLKPMEWPPTEPAHCSLCSPKEAQAGLSQQAGTREPFHWRGTWDLLNGS